MNVVRGEPVKTYAISSGVACFAEAVMKVSARKRDEGGKGTRTLVCTFDRGAREQRNE